jgi:hypothetical protein
MPTAIEWAVIAKFAQFHSTVAAEVKYQQGGFTNQVSFHA